MSGRREVLSPPHCAAGAEVSWLRENVNGRGSSRLGVAHHRQGSVFRSMLGMGRTRTDTNDHVELAPGDGIYR
jgi:hypothetical protein